MIHVRGACFICDDVALLDQCPACGRVPCLGCWEVGACCALDRDAVPVPINDHDQTPDSARTRVHARARHSLKTSGHLSTAVARSSSLAPPPGELAGGGMGVEEVRS